MAKTAREAALTILERIRRNQAFSDSLIQSVLADSGLVSKDRALVSKLSYGVLQNMLLLDFYIDAFCTGASKLEPKVRDILRLSVYQLLFLDRIPDHAAVSQAVELCKKSDRERASGMVNAVLRRVVENRDALPKIPHNSDGEYLSIKYSTPVDLVEEFIKCYGADFTENLLSANNAPAPVTIQVNTIKTTRDELSELLTAENVTNTAHEYLDDCLVLGTSGDFSTLKTFKDGLFYVQDPAAKLSVSLVAETGSRVLDVCAAPGGKSFSTAIAMENKGEIISCDIHENKLSRVRKGAENLGINIIKASVQDATKPCSDFNNSFDLVIADVPCSGLGVIRKKPDIRYKKLNELSNLPDLQYNILNNVSAYVKAGGTLLYSTCTILPCENDAVIDRFLATHPDFSAEDFTLPEPIGRADGGKITLFPHIHGTDGFFICKLRKRP